MKKEDFDTFLEQRPNGLSFAIWLLRRQTRDEIYLKDSVEDNLAGFNKPDALALTPMLVAIEDGDPFSDLTISKFYTVHAQHRLKKYFRQWKQFIKEAQP